VRDVRRLEAEVALRDARLHAQRDEPAAAERALRRAISWAPRRPEPFRTLAEHLLRQGRLDEALAAAEGAVERRPDWSEYWHFLGVVRRRAGDLEGAAAAQREALGREAAQGVRAAVPRVEARHDERPRAAGSR
jgi:tetratricopeptide (TPR) repeat protein